MNAVNQATVKGFLKMNSVRNTARNVLVAGMAIFSMSALIAVAVVAVPEPVVR